MLKELAIVTILVSNLGQVETAWQEQFGYQVAGRGEISPALADFWAADEMAGAPFVIMQPADSVPVYIRFVADDAAADYTAMTSHGWNATELLSADVDLLAANMTDSDFTIIGTPKDLWPAPNAPRVMQAIGPGNELLYITVNQGAAEALGVSDNMPIVERPFIMVLGGPSMNDLQTFYGEVLGLDVDPPTPFKITTISNANELDIETTYPLAIAHAAPGYLIELDELPPVIGAREVAADRLPPGIAVVSFTSDGVTTEVEWTTGPRRLDDFPYNGRLVGLMQGPAGELIEIILPGLEEPLLEGLDEPL